MRKKKHVMDCSLTPSMLARLRDPRAEEHILEKRAYGNILLKLGFSPFQVNEYFADLAPDEFLSINCILEQGMFTVEPHPPLDKRNWDTVCSVVTIMTDGIVHSNTIRSKSFLNANFDQILSALSSTHRMNASLRSYLADIDLQTKQAYAINIFHNIHDYESLRKSFEAGVFANEMKGVSEETRATLSRTVATMPPVKELAFLEDPLFEFDFDTFLEAELMEFGDKIGFPRVHMHKVAEVCCEKITENCAWHNLIRSVEQIRAGNGVLRTVPREYLDLLEKAMKFANDGEGNMLPHHPSSRIAFFDQAAFRTFLAESSSSSDPEPSKKRTRCEKS